MAGVFSRLVGPNGRVYSFEPSPTTYKKLLEVISKNHFLNVAAYKSRHMIQDSSTVNVQYRSWLNLSADNINI